MSLLWAGPDWQARTGPEAGGAHISPAGQGRSQKTMLLPLRSVPTCSPTLGYPGQWLGLSIPGMPRYSLAPLFLSLPCLHIGTAQEGVCCPHLPGALPPPGSSWAEPVLSLGRLYRSEGKGGAEAAETRAAAALLPEPCLRGDIGAWVVGDRPGAWVTAARGWSEETVLPSVEPKGTVGLWGNTAFTGREGET